MNGAPPDDRRDGDPASMPVDVLWDRILASSRLSLSVHLQISPDFRSALEAEAAALGLETPALGEAMTLRCAFGGQWNRDRARRLYPDAEISDEWLAALDRLRDAHLRFRGRSAE